MGAAQWIGFEWTAHRHKREAGLAGVVHDVLLLFLYLILIRWTFPNGVVDVVKALWSKAAVFTTANRLSVASQFEVRRLRSD